MAYSAQRLRVIELYTPKLITVLREGYGLNGLRADVVAGLTVAIVALPLSMAIAIASGVTPDRGLITAIFGGFVVSALGGSRFQIGGPAGAFIVLVGATIQHYGLDGALTATFLAGFILLAAGLLGLGTFVKYIPYPVTVGFTFGIAVIILASQVKELLGLTLAGPEPGPLLPKLVMLAQALPSVSPAAALVSGCAVTVIVAVRRAKPQLPAFLIAAVACSVLVWGAGLPVATIGTRFGGLPQTLPVAHFPSLSLDKVVQLLPAAFSFALLGGIESLLSAVVADSMTGRRHRSNAELVAQGAANVASALFGGICVTGLIARTATNVRAGARSPLAGILHSVFVLLFMLVAGRLANYMPIAALAGVLAVVAWNMAEKHEFITLVRASRGDAVVLLATLLLVVFRDLTTGILVGFGIGALHFLHRMAQAVQVDAGKPLIEPDRPDTDAGEVRAPYDSALATDRDIVVYRISGAFFFGAAATVGSALDRIGDHPRAYVVDFAAVPVIDSTAAATIAGFARKASRHGAVVYIAAAKPPVRRVLLVHGVRPPVVRFRSSAADAVAAARRNIAGQSSADPVRGAPVAAIPTPLASGSEVEGGRR